VYERRAKVRRLRIALAALAILAFVVTGALGVVATALSWDGVLTPGPGWDDRYTITSYETTGTLRDDGDLEVVEDIEVEWHEPRRGLIRDIDRSGPNGELTVSDIEVTSRTQDDVWFEVRVDETEGHDSVHLGEEFDFRPLGSDHYRIAYVLEGLLVEVDGTPTLRWDTFGDQWDTLIERAAVTLDLPPGDHRYACALGAFGQAFPCDGEGPTWGATELRPGRGITVEAQLDPSPVDAASLPTADLGPLERFSNLALRRIGLIVAITVGASLPLLATIGSPRTRRRRREAQQRIETTGVTYVPPPNVRPLTAGMLVHGESSAAKDDQLFAAWLLDAQRRDLIQVAPEEKGFRVRFAGSGTPDSQREAATLRALVPSVHGWVTWDAKTPQKRARTFDSAWQTLRDHHRELAGVPRSASAGLDLVDLLVLGVAVVVGIAVSTVLPPGGILIGAGALGAWGASTYTDRTLRTSVAAVPDDHAELWRQLEGLRRFVSEAHADQISGLADDPSVPLASPYLELLPWVIAFGYGEQWAERFPLQVRAATEPWGYYAPMRASEVGAVRAAARPASSSSGSGGGASGVGSGGGGGGGGSR
jgi:uncharacterized membrane protein YgcG